MYLVGVFLNSVLVQRVKRLVSEYIGTVEEIQEITHVFFVAIPVIRLHPICDLPREETVQPLAIQSLDTASSSTQRFEWGMYEIRELENMCTSTTGSEIFYAFTWQLTCSQSSTALTRMLWPG
jgi:hypothetical protein